MLFHSVQMMQSSKEPGRSREQKLSVTKQYHLVLSRPSLNNDRKGSSVHTKQASLTEPLNSRKTSIREKGLQL